MKIGKIVKGKQLEERGTIRPTPEFIKRDGIWLRIWMDRDNKEYVAWEKGGFAEVIREETNGTKVDPTLVENKIEEKKIIPEKREEIEKPKEVKLGTTKIQKRKEKDEGILMIERASSYAGILKDIIEKQKLYVDVEGKKFVTCEGWQVLGALLKCTAKITNVTKTNEGYYAEAEISNIEGKVLGKGQALCKFDETITRKDGTTFKRWDSEFKVMSMAQTRAVSKAFRLSFSWILKIAGYEVTPAEEMEGV